MSIERVVAVAGGAFARRRGVHECRILSLRDFAFSLGRMPADKETIVAEIEIWAKQ